MIKVIVATYYWPPSGGPAVQRWLSFANLLCEKNIEITILTPDAKNASFPVIDIELLNKVSHRINVIHVPIKDNFRFYKKFIGKGRVPASGFVNETNTFLQKVARFVRGNFYYPDPRKNWVTKAISIVQELVESGEHINLITAGPPHSTHLIGKKIKSDIHSINWIADFHDAWTDIWFYDKLYKTPFAKAIDSRMEKSILEEADYVITVGEYLKQVLSDKVKPTQRDKFALVSMGYDDSIDFSPMNSDTEKFRICYTGTLDEEYNPWIIFDSVKTLIEEGFNIELVFVGMISKSIREYVSQLSMNENVVFVDYVAHSESVVFLRKSDALLLISPQVRSERLIIPGKLYEYLAAQKPIINIGLKDTNTAKIIEDCNAGINVDRNEKTKIEAYLREWLVQRKKDSSYSPSVSNNKVKDFSRQVEVEKIIRILSTAK